MAKWGENDPRWLVQDQGKEGRNPGSWHWEEKNLTAWSRSKLGELLVGVSRTVNDGSGKIELTELKECKGEAYLTRRKGNKKFAQFELELKVGWRGCWEADETQVEGSVCVKEFASFHERDEWLFSAAADAGSSGGEHGPLLAACAAELKHEVFARLAEYVDALSAQEM